MCLLSVILKYCVYFLICSLSLLLYVQLTLIQCLPFNSDSHKVINRLASFLSLVYSIHHRLFNMFLVIFISKSFSVVVRVDKVEVNVRVAASRLHVRPDDIFLGGTKIKSTWTQLTWDLQKSPSLPPMRPSTSSNTPVSTI